MSTSKKSFEELFEEIEGVEGMLCRKGILLDGETLDEVESERIIKELRVWCEDLQTTVLVLLRTKGGKKGFIEVRPEGTNTVYLK